LKRLLKLLIVFENKNFIMLGMLSSVLMLAGIRLSTPLFLSAICIDDDIIRREKLSQYSMHRYPHTFQNFYHHSAHNYLYLIVSIFHPVPTYK
jgi:hypothetical protein